MSILKHNIIPQTNSKNWKQPLVTPLLISLSSVASWLRRFSQLSVVPNCSWTLWALSIQPTCPLKVWTRRRRHLLSRETTRSGWLTGSSFHSWPFWNPSLVSWSCSFPFTIGSKLERWFGCGTRRLEEHRPFTNNSYDPLLCRIWKRRMAAAARPSNSQQVLSIEKKLKGGGSIIIIILYTTICRQVWMDGWRRGW